MQSSARETLIGNTVAPPTVETVRPNGVLLCYKNPSRSSFQSIASRIFFFCFVFSFSFSAPRLVKVIRLPTMSARRWCAAAPDAIPSRRVECALLIPWSTGSFLHLVLLLVRVFSWSFRPLPFRLISSTKLRTTRDLLSIITENNERGLRVMYVLCFESARALAPAQ